MRSQRGGLRKFAAFPIGVVPYGSAFLYGDLGLSVVPCPDHACYLASWLKVLKDDNRAIFTAASAAAKAAEWLGDQQE